MFILQLVYIQNNLLNQDMVTADISILLSHSDVQAPGQWTSIWTLITQSESTFNINKNEGEVQ